MERFWNELAWAARGTWFFCFNDDALMDTAHWDDEFYRIATEMRPRPRLIGPTDDSTNYNWIAFPLVHREIHDRLGHLTLFPSVDNWLQEVVIRPGVWPIVQTNVVRIRHRRPNRPESADFIDQTWQESNEAISDIGPGWAFDPRWKQLVHDDILILGEP